MANDADSRRLDRLAKRAKELDDLIANAAKLQKGIVEEIRRIGQRDRLTKQRASATLKTRRTKQPRTRRRQ